jgi:hypothetical protein
MEQSAPSQSSLPRFPAKRMTQEDFDNYTNQLIGAYWSLRITNPYPRTQGIKNVRVQLPPPGELTQSVANPPESGEVFPGSLPTAQPVQSQSRPQPKVDVPKCFLHAKPKPSCPRCKAFVDAKREGIPETAAKRQKLDK